MEPTCKKMETKVFTNLDRKENAKLFLDIVRARKITELVHFSNRKNLSAILEYGLLGRVSLEDKGISYSFTDEMRMDKKKNGICLSVSKKNDLFLRKCIKKFPNERWIEFAIDPEIILYKECWFYYRNAASTEFSSDKKNTTPEYFEGMFSNEVRYTSKYGPRVFTRKGKESFETSEPQAEIIVDGDIGKEFFISVNLI